MLKFKCALSQTTEESDDGCITEPAPASWVRSSAQLLRALIHVVPFPGLSSLKGRGADLPDSLVN